MQENNKVNSFCIDDDDLTRDGLSIYNWKYCKYLIFCYSVIAARLTAAVLFIMLFNYIQ